MLRKLVLLLIVACALSAVSQTSNSFDGHSWWDHVKVLADDNMEGRDTGSPGHLRAARFLAGEARRSNRKGAAATREPSPLVGRRWLWSSPMRVI